jgi:hypothetical protein
MLWNQFPLLYSLPLSLSTRPKCTSRQTIKARTTESWVGSRRLFHEPSPPPARGRRSLTDKLSLETEEDILCLTLHLTELSSHWLYLFQMK